ncbi:hypothetical protein PR202_gb17799 [Eleusine coracana subsp. coracana]|uniref:non-specific serine/threonine protein kinase n=1 Tax=Eleusine coracana subsp. coracana TaxID=191504 RepID=A0AAV5F5P1_ELECO|nr:hypothetical protein PR202_gb17799 [Eleusine coracana subsp. coracana]
MALRGIFSFTVILFLFLLVSSISCANDQRYLARGSSISTQDDTIAILVSPNGAFSCGFYKVATNTFTFSIWFSWSSEKTVTWTANRDAPVNGKGSKITFQKNGLYTFYFDSNNILTLIYNGPETSSIYWLNPDYRWWENGRTAYNSSQYGVLDQKGQFVASDQFEFQASDLGDEVMRRLTLDYDGNLRLYSLNTSSGHWRNVNLTSKWNWSKGSSGKTNNTDSKQFSFRKISGIDFWGYDFNFTEAVPLWKCKKMCLEKQDCQAFAYRKGEGKCYPKVLLINGKNFTHPYNDIYLKVPEVTVSLTEMSPGLSMNCKVTEKEAYPSSQLFEGGPSRHSAEILKKKLASEDQSWLLDVVDYRLNGDLNYSQAAMMVKIAVSCVEEERTRRPTMSLVVETLLSVME